tara:strand:+ start:105 stop:1583 length:1479 start_codon:yes stop_codon:yes gene_type:complete
MCKKVIIIGSGIAGLASAIRLSNYGYSVIVFESNTDVGGKISEINKNGYRFDTGPSLFTMPELMDELVKIGYKNANKKFDYKEIDITCSYFFDDGVVLNAYSDNKRFIDEVSNKLNVDSKIIRKYLNYVAFLFKSTNKIFIKKSLHKLSTYLSIETLFSFFKIPFLSIFKSMNKTNTQKLKNPKLIKIFNRYATYNGSNPFLAPGILNVISHLELNEGVFLPNKGMRSIVNCLYEICIKNGVVFKLGSKVDKIDLMDNIVKGIYSKKEYYSADIIISNIDIHYVYNNLLNKPNYLNNHTKNNRSTSAIIFYWGIKKTFEKLSLHNILFAKDYENEFNEIKNSKNIQSDPTIYINITSKHIVTDAPKNSENWFVMINVSHNKGQNWDLLVQNARQKIIKKINRFLNTDIEKFIEYEEYMDPTRIELMTGSFQGSLYGTSSNDRMSAFLRHPNFTNKIKNLYFCGGTVHPGGGIPLALNSSKIVTNEIISYKKK